MEYPQLERYEYRMYFQADQLLHSDLYKLLHCTFFPQLSYWFSNI